MLRTIKAPWMSHAIAAAAVLALTGGVALAGDRAKSDSDKTQSKADEKQGGETEPLKLELPQAQFDGTPKDLAEQDLRLDPERLKRVKNKSIKRDPIRVPAGTKLISRGKPVTASEDWPIIGSAEMVTDGDKAASPGSFLELGPGKQWVRIDLKDEYAIHAIVVWHYHQQARVYRDVVVQVSSDKNFEKDVTTVFNNDADNSLGFGAGEDYEFLEYNEGKVIRVDGVEGRYVRLYSNGNTSNAQNHYTEVEVFGKQPTTTAADKGEASDKQTAKADEQK